MAAVAAQGAQMMQELLRILKMPLYWLLLGTGVAIRIILAYFDRMYRTELFWMLCADFWNKVGGFTVATVILAVLIRVFSIDYENGVQDVICSTAFGRLKLFCKRLFAIALNAAIAVVILAVANAFISAFFGRGLAFDDAELANVITKTAVALCGSIGLSIVAGAVCDISKSQPITLCVCGVPFIISVFINADVIQPLELFWFFRYGFFTELMRGRPLHSLPTLWAVWYTAMIILVLSITLKARKERKEL